MIAWKAHLPFWSFELVCRYCINWSSIFGYSLFTLVFFFLNFITVRTVHILKLSGTLYPLELKVNFVILGMVVFRIKGENELTERLLKRLNQRGNIHCVPSSLKGKYVIR